MRRALPIVLALAGVAFALALLLLRGDGDDFDDRFERAEQKLETLADDIESDLDATTQRR